jgi:hypothetical protein
MSGEKSCIASKKVCLGLWRFCILTAVQCDIYIDIPNWGVAEDWNCCCNWKLMCSVNAKISCSLVYELRCDVYWSLFVSMKAQNKSTFIRFSRVSVFIVHYHVLSQFSPNNYCTLLAEVDIVMSHWCFLHRSVYFKKTWTSSQLSLFCGFYHTFYV